MESGYWPAPMEHGPKQAVGRALAWSLALHFILFAAVELGYRIGWWRMSLLSAVTTDAQESQRQLAQQNRVREVEVPLIFVEVDPSQAATEAPAQAKYYSSRNSIAANRDTNAEMEQPEITGRQENVAKTMDVPRVEAPAPPAKPEPLQPQVAPEPLQPQPPEAQMAEVKTEPEPVAPTPPAKVEPKPGDMTLAKAEEKPRPAAPPAQKTDVNPARPAPRERPKSLAMARQQQGMPGEKMKQEGGVRRRATLEGLDVRATPFGSYDQAIIEAIQKRWYDLLDDRYSGLNFTGKVVLTFRLNADGRVSELRVQENEVSDFLAFLCQRAVQDPSPFAPWPSEMRRTIGADFREVRFTFYYN